jgi:hypothetical protein
MAVLLLIKWYKQVIKRNIGLVSQPHWTSIPKLADSIPTVVRQTFQLARCGCTLRVTPQTSGYQILKFLYFLFSTGLNACYCITNMHAILFYIFQEHLNLFGLRRCMSGCVSSKEILFTHVCFSVHWVIMLEIWRSNLAQCKSVKAQSTIAWR